MNRQIPIYRAIQKFDLAPGWLTENEKGATKDRGNPVHLYYKCETGKKTEERVCGNKIP